MALNYTFSIIKPDAFNAGKAGKIVAHLEAQGFTLKAARVMQLTKKQAEEFYAVHRGRPFYGELVEFMSSAPCMPFILQKDNAVLALRDAIGATDPAEAAAGTVRKLYAESKGKNAIHASDSDENAVREARFFFAEAEVV
jgi:nucleoside-diphosphate kinase